MRRRRWSQHVTNKIQLGTYCIQQTQFIEFIHFVTLFSNPWLNQNPMAIYPLSAANFVRCFNYISQFEHRSHSTRHLFNSNANTKKKIRIACFFSSASPDSISCCVTPQNWIKDENPFVFLLFQFVSVVKFTDGSLIFNCLRCGFQWAHVRSDCKVLGKWSHQPRRRSLLYER